MRQVGFELQERRMKREPDQGADVVSVPEDRRDRDEVDPFARHFDVDERGRVKPVVDERRSPGGVNREGIGRQVSD